MLSMLALSIYFCTAPGVGPIELQLSDAHGIAGSPTQLVAQVSPAIEGMQVEFLLNNHVIGAARTDSQGVAVIDSGVTPADPEIRFRATSLSPAGRLQAVGRWFTSPPVEKPVLPTAELL